MIRKGSPPPPTRVAKCLRKLCRISFSNLGVLLVVLVYLIFGGFLFQFLENRKKFDNRAYFRRHRDECIQQLWTITKSAHVLYKQNWTIEALDPLRKFEASVLKEINLNHKLLVRRWTFSDSLFYSVTILTTIGYNSYTPNTSFGKIATIIYATFGIPLMLLCICNVGFMLSDLLQFGQLHKSTLQCEYLGQLPTTDSGDKTSSHEKVIYDGPTIVKRDTIVSVTKNKNENCSSNIRHVVLNSSNSTLHTENLTKYGSIKPSRDCSLCDQCDNFDINCDWCRENISFKIRDPDAIVSSEKQNSGHQTSMPRSVCYPIACALFLLVMYIFFGALVYSTWKNQSFADGAYFCFLTLTTIGSCDAFRNVFSVSNETSELLFGSLYLVVGLVLTTALVVLVQRNIIKIESISSIYKFPRKNDQVAL